MYTKQLIYTPVDRKERPLGSTETTVLPRRVPYQLQRSQPNIIIIVVDVVERWLWTSPVALDGGYGRFSKKIKKKKKMIFFFLVFLNARSVLQPSGIITHVRVVCFFFINWFYPKVCVNLYTAVWCYEDHRRRRRRREGNRSFST